MKNSRAAVEERRMKVIQLLEDEPNYSVKDLAELLSCSAITIRRDLHHLEDNATVRRGQGSAKLAMAGALREDKDIFQTAREAIADYAAGLVEDGDTIFVNTGRTTQAFIAALRGKGITVITNNIKALETPVHEGVTLMFTGGEVSYPAFWGEFAVNALKMVTASKCFIGVNGISEEGMTTHASMQAPINALMLSRCVGEKIVITDSSKVGKRLNFHTGSLSDISCIITDSMADPGEIQKIKDAGVRVILMDAQTRKAV